MDNIYEVLKERGFIEAVTDEQVSKAVLEPIKVYCGFDPSGDSLHVGHLVPIMALRWFQKLGHTPIALVGGATGMIGDPSGKSKERNFLTKEKIQQNIIGLEKNLKQVLSFEGDNQALLLNNNDWFSEFSLIDFLRDVGKYFRLGPMLAKDSVKSRFESEEGMSFTEFCYQILQGYDFFYLLKNHGVSFQIGGGDQWGNITAGCELIRKMDSSSAYGITFPLLTRSDGKKFGKTEEGAVWLSAEKCTPYEFYQYFVRIPDADVIYLMKLLTFMELEEIYNYQNLMNQENYLPNTAQKKLAEEVTSILHGKEGLLSALAATKIAKPGTDVSLDIASLNTLKGEIPFYDITLDRVVSQKLIDIIVLLKLQKSKGEVRRLIQNGGLYLNNEKVLDFDFEVKQDMLIGEKLLLISLGKKRRIVLQIV
ncbi:tyrosine--tRNA ligase [Chlamydiales bacterium]|nr:tyrosine--tRNA ligase [Chlamydiales bacterium]